MEMKEGVVLPHYRWPGDPDKVMLAGFDTGQAELKSKHRGWLSHYALPKLQNAVTPHWLYLRGYASRRGEGRFDNNRLSGQRVDAAERYLLQRGGNNLNITGVHEVGSNWSSGDDNDNSYRWRAVEAIITQSPRPPEPITDLSTHFFIKLTNGATGGLGDVTVSNYEFVIRNDKDWWTYYGFVGGGGSLGLPITIVDLDKLPPPRGWVPFTTTRPRRVDSFGGRSYVHQAGIQAGPVGTSTDINLLVPAHNIDVDLPARTPFGISASIGQAELGAFTALGPPRHNKAWNLK